MRLFALLTSAFVLGLAAFAVVLPSADAYIEGVDDGPPQRFSTLADAAKAAGYDLPNPGNLPGWQIEAAIVTPVFHGRNLQEQLLKKPVRLFPPTKDGRVIIIRRGPEPPRGLHNYVDVTYVAETGVHLTLSFNRPLGETVANAESRDETRVRIGNVPATLVTYTTASIEILYTGWQVDGVRITATAFNLSQNPRYRITREEFLAFLAAVR